MAEECAGIFWRGIIDIFVMDDFFEKDLASLCCRSGMHSSFYGDIVIYLSIADR